MARGAYSLSLVLLLLLGADAAAARTTDNRWTYNANSGAPETFGSAHAACQGYIDNKSDWEGGTVLGFNSSGRCSFEYQYDGQTQQSSYDVFSYWICENAFGDPGWERLLTHPSNVPEGGDCFTEPCTDLQPQWGTGPITGGACMGGCQYYSGASDAEETKAAKVGDEIYAKWWPAGHDEVLPDATEAERVCQVTEDEETLAGGTTTLGEGLYDVESEEPNCGTFNGERVCADSIPASGNCVKDGSGGYTCASGSSSPVDPEHDPTTETVEQQVGPVTVDIIDSQGNIVDRVTVSGGQIVSGGESLDEGTGNATEGSDAAEHESQQDEEERNEEEETEESLCEEAPHLCETEFPEPGPNDGDVPKTWINLDVLTGSYNSTVADTAPCPDPREIGFSGITFQIPFTAFCDWADMLRPMFIAAAWLASVFFAVRALA